MQHGCSPSFIAYQEVKGEQSGSTKFFSKKLKALKAAFQNKKNKKKELEGDGNLEASGKKFSSNGSLVSQANGVKQATKGENPCISVTIPIFWRLNYIRSINRKRLQSRQNVA